MTTLRGPARRPTPWRAITCLALVGMLLAGIASANEEATSETHNADERIELDVRSGQAIKLKRPVASIFVADPETADVQAHSPTLVYVFAKQTGSTSVFAVDAGENVMFRRTIVVRHALADLREALNVAVPDNAIEVSSFPGGIILSGEVASPAISHDAVRVAEQFLGENETIVNRLDISAAVQVNLRVRVAEMSREVTKLFAVNLDAAAEIGDTFFSFLSGRSFLSENRSTFSRFVDNNGPAGSFLGSYTGDDFAIDSMIDALEREGLASILAEPNLTAISGETATFLAGGEFPVPIGRDDNEIEIEFKEFGVRLAFTPTVLHRERISLQVRPEVSDLDFSNALELSGVLVPALKTRRAETTIELGSGQSFAIGGLISNNTQSNLEKFPGLGDVPVLGTLFRSSNFQRSETELVIIVTPYLVRPTKPDRLSTPTDRYRPATDIDRILSGRLRHMAVERGEDGAAPAPTARLVGPAGFMLD